MPDFRIEVGQPFDLDIETPDGVIEVAAEVRADGETLVVENVMVYRHASKQGAAERRATKELIRHIRLLQGEAGRLGFRRVQILADRSPGSSAAQPGRRVDFDFEAKL